MKCTRCHHYEASNHIEVEVPYLPLYNGDFCPNCFSVVFPELERSIKTYQDIKQITIKYVVTGPPVAPPEPKLTTQQKHWLIAHNKPVPPTEPRHTCDNCAMLPRHRWAQFRLITIPQLKGYNGYYCQPCNNAKIRALKNYHPTTDYTSTPYIY